MTTTPSRVRTIELIEKFTLGATAGGATAIGMVESVWDVGRIIRLASGPVVLTNVPTNAPLDAGFANATFDTVTLTIADPYAGIRVLLMGAVALTWLLVVGICAVLAWLCTRVFLGKPFGVVATWGTGAVSLLVLASGLGTPMLNGMAAQRIAFTLGLKELPHLAFTVDLAPVGWALALAVVSAVFQIGQRMQRETDGLV